MKYARIPSPLEYLSEVPDPREYLKTAHEWEDLMLMSLMALGSGRTNILAMAQWIEDEEPYRLEGLKIRNRYGQRRRPAQARVYRFFWFLDSELAAVSTAMLEWGRDVLRALGEKRG